MHYNLRSEIIYYKSGSDFELEFNLCGCCRMRLLTDKPTNKKSFVYSLARAVSRSRVILIAGPIFGEENTIEIVSQALDTTTEIANNEAYNIASDDEIKIIKNSIPLVGDDGSFGGCIIESGPQTMILLTDNKTLRKNIMSNLIHPYITDLYTAEMNGNNIKPTENDIRVDTEPELILDQNDNAQEILVESVPEETTEPEDIQLIFPEEPDSLKHDIKPEDIFIETPEAEEYEEDKHDISIEDLIPNTNESGDPLRTIDETLNEAKIVLDDEDETLEDGEFPEEYQKAFIDFRLSEFDSANNDGDVNNHKPNNEFQFLDDEGEIIGERETIFETKKPGIHMATIFITIVLLLSIIVLCFCIFSATTTKDLAPAQYIQELWQTLFG